MPKKYVCGITFSCELGHTEDVSVYDSLEELKRIHWYWKECGIVEIETDGKAWEYTDHTWLEPMDLRYGAKKDE